jgi:hypothetical protein
MTTGHVKATGPAFPAVDKFDDSTDNDDCSEGGLRSWSEAVEIYVLDGLDWMGFRGVGNYVRGPMLKNCGIQ